MAKNRLTNCVGLLYSEGMISESERYELVEGINRGSILADELISQGLRRLADRANQK